MRLSLTGIEKSYGANRVLSDFSLSLNEGAFLAVLGRSGCGKSTFLRIAGGLEAPDHGTVLLDGQAVSGPGERMVIFQDPNQLFAWMTLAQNIRYAIGKRCPGLGRKQANTLAAESLAEVGLSDAADRYPHELSGGMKQRGALARALAVDARVLLLDEPFCSLDYLTRKQAQQTLKQLWERRRMTVVFVTHDIEEALTLAERIAVFDAHGKIGTLLQNDGEDSKLRESLETLLLTQGA